MDDVINPEPLWSVFISASLVNNFVFAYFLGICPFLGVSGSVKSAARMGVAVAFVMLVATVCGFAIERLLVRIDAPYLNLISLVAVIASTVQLIEIFVNRGRTVIESFVKVALWMSVLTVASLLVRVLGRRSGTGGGDEPACGGGLGCTALCNTDIEPRCDRNQRPEPQRPDEPSQTQAGA